MTDTAALVRPGIVCNGSRGNAGARITSGAGCKGATTVDATVRLGGGVAGAGELTIAATVCWAICSFVGCKFTEGRRFCASVCVYFVNDGVFCDGPPLTDGVT